MVDSKKYTLVTGGAGFVGSNTIELLLQNGHNVLVLDNFSNSDGSNLKFAKNSIEVFNCDITDYKKCQEIFQTRNINKVVHLAADLSVEKSINSPIETRRTNIGGFHNIIDLSKDFGVEKFVYASSAAVYGNNTNLPLNESEQPSPISPYGLEKLVNEQYAKLYKDLYNFNSIGFRYFNIYGKNQNPNSPYAGVISIFIENALNNYDLKIYGNGQQCRDFVSVVDVAEANLLALDSDQKLCGGIYNVATSVPTSILQLAEIITKITKSQSAIKYLDKKAGDIENSIAAISSIKNSLSFEAKTTLEIGLQNLVSFYTSAMQIKKAS